MRRITRYIVILCLYASVYMIFVENFSWLNFGIGLAVSFIAFIFSNKFLLFDKYDKLFPVKFIGLIFYFVYLMGKIMTSGVQAAIMTIKGEGQMQYEWYESNLSNDFALNLLANSITLTPGTVTVNRKDNELFVMQLSKDGEDFDVESIIEFEKKINNIVLSESE